MVWAIGVFWGLIRSTEISSINWFDILHLIFDTWHLTFDIDMLLTLICCDIWQLIFDIYAEFVWLHCCFTQHSNASYSTLLHTLQIFAIFVYFALVPSHALGASTSRAATLLLLLPLLLFFGQIPWQLSNFTIHCILLQLFTLGLDSQFGTLQGVIQAARDLK